MDFFKYTVKTYESNEQVGYFNRVLIFDIENIMPYKDNGFKTEFTIYPYINCYYWYKEIKVEMDDYSAYGYPNNGKYFVYQAGYDGALALNNVQLGISLDTYLDSDENNGLGDFIAQGIYVGHSKEYSYKGDKFISVLYGAAKKFLPSSIQNILDAIEFTYSTIDLFESFNEEYNNQNGDEYNIKDIDSIIKQINSESTFELNIVSLFLNYLDQIENYNKLIKTMLLASLNNSSLDKMYYPYDFNKKDNYIFSQFILNRKNNGVYNNLSRIISLSFVDLNGNNYLTTCSNYRNLGIYKVWIVYWFYLFCV